MIYRPEIDGLRAIAVISVIFFHAGFGFFSGGYTGVDVFFVISGYLISSIIIDSEENFSLMSFYERRARRILPALLLVLLVTLPFAWFLLLPKDLKNFSESLVAAATFSSNIFFWLKSGYFDTSNELKPLLHIWSLALEEQFYIFFPIIFIFLLKLNKRLLNLILLALFLVSIILAQWGSYKYPSATYFLLPFRIWEFIIGIFVALYLNRKSNPVNVLKINYASQIFSFLGLIFLLISVFIFDSTIPFPSVYGLLPTIGTVLIILFCHEDTLVGRLLGCKFFVGIGLISFSAYLWHQPLLAFVRYRSIYGLSEVPLYLIVMLSFLLAFISWKFVEKPFRSRFYIESNKIPIFIIGSFVIALLGLVGYLHNGFQERISLPISWVDIDVPRRDNGWCFYDVGMLSKVGQAGTNCWIGDMNSNKQGMLFGDSFAGAYDPLWNMAGIAAHLKINSISTNQCYPSANEDFNGSDYSSAKKQCIVNRQYLIKNLKNYEFVILSGHWGDVVSKDKMQGVMDLLDIIVPRVKLVVIMSSPPQYDINVMNSYEKSKLYYKKFDINLIPKKRDKNALKGNEILKEAAKEYKNVFFIDRETLFNTNNIYSELTYDDVPYSYEGTHLSIYGSKIAAKNFINSNDFMRLKNKF